MNQRQYENAVRGLIYKAVVVPTIIVVGMYVVGSMLASFLEIGNPFPTLFAVIGGVPAVGYYYSTLWKKEIGRR